MSIFYDFVDFLGPVRNFDGKGNLTGKMVIYLKALAPIFVGSGYEDMEGRLLYRCFERYNGVPVIPGSTLKGVLRTISQAVSYSCVEVGRDIQKDLPQDFRNCNCIVCNTYGKMGQKGRIIVGDLLLKEGRTEKIKIPIQMAPHIEKKEIYYKNNKLRGIKFYRHGDYRLIQNLKILVETVMPGSIFEGEIIFKDLHPGQLELLCYSLGLDGSFNLKVGGNKSGFFGSCEIGIISAVLNGKDFVPSQYAKNYGGDDKGILANKKKLSSILNFNNMVKAL